MELTEEEERSNAHGNHDVAVAELDIDMIDLVDEHMEGPIVMGIEQANEWLFRDMQPLFFNM